MSPRASNSWRNYALSETEYAILHVKDNRNDTRLDSLAKNLNNTTSKFHYGVHVKALYSLTPVKFSHKSKNF